MRRNLPSLSALQCFDAAHRHLSFTRAAEELCLTQSAVSRQIRQLEDFLGRPLFERIKQRLVLTTAGEAYGAVIREVLDRAEAATIQLKSHQDENKVLHLAVLPTFGTRWLIPRLGTFYAAHPDIELNISSRTTPFDFSNEDLHGAIHFGPALWPGAVCHRLMGEKLVPVCSPQLLPNGKALTDIDELHHYKRLQLTSRPQAWNEWLHHAGAEDIDAFAGPRFEQFQMVIQAALSGLGIALLPMHFIENELNSGALTIAYDHPMENSQAYYFVYPASRADTYAVRAFKDWINLTIASE
ncbi:transcriptional regulator GcvA [Leeia sp. TBRC 13508]|uniref:Transcriptional regulator GcvA n=1 Tax=Leeia speluncae TaxID=2884804 RepID=A0ABS8D8H9_9NEIS|nr:transcriptional regulator GcvA [Leeia speluncae]MCB6184523.1 transcriptional regulator GcvA [Leeia speluncae]